MKISWRKKKTRQKQSFVAEGRWSAWWLSWGEHAPERYVLHIRAATLSPFQQIPPTGLVFICRHKSTLLAEVERALVAQGASVVALSQDCYYKDQSHLSIEQRLAVNYDEPAAFDQDLFALHLRALREGKAVAAPAFDYVGCVRAAETRTVGPAAVVLVDGLLLLHDPEVRALFQLLVYVDAPADVRLARRISRDVAAGMRGEDVLAMYRRFVAPMHALHVEAHRHAAHLVIPTAGASIDPVVPRFIAAALVSSSWSSSLKAKL